MHGPFSVRAWSVQYPYNSRLTSVFLKRSSMKQTMHGRFFFGAYRTHTHTQTQTDIYRHRCACAHTHTHTHRQRQTYTDTDVHVHTHTHAHTHLLTSCELRSVWMEVMYILGILAASSWMAAMTGAAWGTLLGRPT